MSHLDLPVSSRLAFRVYADLPSYRTVLRKKAREPKTGVNGPALQVVREGKERLPLPSKRQKQTLSSYADASLCLSPNEHMTGKSHAIFFVKGSPGGVSCVLHLSVLHKRLGVGKRLSHT